MATIVDSLIVTLGLDPSDFTKGQKEASAALLKGQQNVRKSVKETDAQVSKGAKEMGKAITSAARQFTLAFLGFSGAAGFTKFMANLNQMARATKMSASNLDMQTGALKRWNNVAELAGSSAQSLNGFLEQIQEQQYQQRTTGLPGWVKELRSMKLDLFDGQAGKFKDETQVALELAEKFAEVRKQLGQDTAVQRFKGMGIDPSIINMLSRGRGWIEQQLARQQQRYGDNDNAYNAADKVAQKFTDVRQRLEDFGIKLLAKLQPFIDQILSKFDSWLAHVDMNKLADGIIELTTQLAALVPVLTTLAGGAASVMQKTGTWLGETAGALADKWREFGDQPTVAAGREADPTVNALWQAVAGDSMRSRRNLTTAEIVDKLGLQNDERGQRRYMGLIQNATGVTDVNKVLSFEEQKKIEDLARQLAIQAASKPAATTGALLGIPNAVQAAQGAGASAAVASAGNTSRSSTVSIGEVNLYGAGNDGRRIAGDFTRELERKGLIAQANAGLA